MHFRERRPVVRIGLRWSAGVRVGVVVGAAAVALAACGSSSSSSAGAQSSGSSGATSAGSSAAAKSPIVIGDVGIYSGFNADVAQATAQGVQAWAKAVNAAGGIDGHPVQVIVKDDGGVAAKAVVAVKDLIQNDHVVALVGNHESGVDAAWASYADAQHVPVVGGVAAGSSYATDPNFFPVTPTNNSAYSSYVNAAKLFGKTSVSVAYCAEVPACAQGNGLTAQFAKQLGLKDVTGQPVSASATGYAAQCQKFKDSDAQAIFAASDLTTAGRIISQCAQQSYHPLWILSARDWKDSDVSNSAWEGSVLVGNAPLWFGDGPGTAEFLAAMKAYEPNAVLNTNATSGWYAGKVFEQAVKAANPTGAITSQTVYDGLYKLGPNFDLGGILSGVTYTQGQPAKQQLCDWYVQIKGGKATTPQGANKICVPSA
jgi:branched-chain amino acid transport system substrate-binding protein